MYKFQPIYKTTVWGGERIASFKGVATSLTHVGESWELSGVKGSESVVSEGEQVGATLPELVAREGAALVGEKNLARFGTEFPLLIKFIDAEQDLSIQVHPDDALALERHGKRGKT
jgi:mannose-6-phosphate isomerase